MLLRSPECVVSLQAGIQVKGIGSNSSSRASPLSGISNVNSVLMATNQTMSRRTATHAGSWYPQSKASLEKQLQSFIDETGQGDHNLPGCRIIISPHAGYSYSGPTAAFGFKALDWSHIKRVFILGPSHHFYLKGCALSRCKVYETPLGALDIDVGMIDELANSSLFDDMSLEVDEDEHSIEMQLPFLRMIMPQEKLVPIVPVLVGNLCLEKEIEYGQFFSKYLADEGNLFVISSDFCHWGDRFRYKYYQAPQQQATARPSSSSIATDWPIWRSIEHMDHHGMAIIEKGSHKDFAEYLAETRNTICGRHPIGVILAALENCEVQGQFRFLDYRQSNKVVKLSDGSVSYASGVCRLLKAD